LANNLVVYFERGIAKCFNSNWILDGFVSLKDSLKDVDCDSRLLEFMSFCTNAYKLDCYHIYFSMYL
jgi:hypothetical protein